MFIEYMNTIMLNQLIPAFDIKTFSTVHFLIIAIVGITLASQLACVSQTQTV